MDIVVGCSQAGNGRASCRGLGLYIAALACKAKGNLLRAVKSVATFFLRELADWVSLRLVLCG